MKRTKRMMLVTLMATTAIAMLLMSRALAAPSTCPYAGNTAGTTATSSCPTNAILSRLLGTSGSNLITTTGSCPSAATLQQLLKNGALTGCASGTCPTSATLQQLLGKYGITGNITAACPNGTCPKTTTGTNPAPVNSGSTGTATPAPTPKPAPTPAPTSTGTAPATGSMSADERKMIDLVNKDRAANGLPALTFDASLRSAALAHSQDMSQNNYFSHTSPTLGDFSTRLKASGVKYSSAGENIAMYGSVEQAEVGFMNSPGHRANILGNYTRVGIGIVYNQSKGAYYITQWFAR